MRIWEDNSATYIPVTIQFTNEAEFKRFINIIKDVQSERSFAFPEDKKLCRTILELISKL